MQIIDEKITREVKRTANNGYTTSKKERRSYSFYLLGQNIFYVMCAALLTNYATDIGINPLILAPVLLLVKVWDAFNDTLFGVLVDKFHLKSGKFKPWLKISLIGIPISTILLFSVPREFSELYKVIWIGVAYLLWDTSYTICDIPIYGLPTAMTTNQDERTKIMSNGRLLGGLGYNFAFAAVPLINGFLRDSVKISFTWELTVILFSLLSFIMMIPICFHGKERTKPESVKPISFKEMGVYMLKNKYLLLFYLSYIIVGVFGIGGSLTIYVGRYLTPYMDAYATISGVISLVPFILVAIFIPVLAKKYDKFYIFVFGIILGILLSILSYIAGYKNQVVFWIFSFLRTFPAAIIGTLTFMFTADCAEYGFYKTKSNAAGCAFATQTFSAKLNGTLAILVSLLMLGIIGFIEGEPVNGVPVLQNEFFNDRLWLSFIIVPQIGYLIGFIPLYFYKLRDYKIEIMANANQKIISEEDANKLLNLSRKEYLLYKKNRQVTEVVNDSSDSTSEGKKE
ncbi:MAG: MFS transporter [Acholeplasmatales bacterium]|jgi:Na+/melibiose symporter-like transporter|nr:MFS transporter [Acholeplasmatales bacterium]